MGNCNCQSHSHSHGCSCPHCEEELKSGCMSPEFCKPCGVKNKNIRICYVCGAKYSSEYDKCPSCSIISD